MPDGEADRAMKRLAEAPGSPGGGRPDVRSVLVASLVVAILTMIAIAALSTH